MAITVSKRTKKRLAGYKRGDMSSDDLLNALLDRVPMEDLAAEQILGHHHRLRTYRGVSVETFQRRVRRRLMSGR